MLEEAMVGDVGGVVNVNQETAVVSGPSRGAGNAVKTMTVQPGKTARGENVLQLDPMATAVFPTLTVPLATAVVYGPSRGVGNAAKTITVQLGKTARAENVLHLDPMATAVFPILTVPLATAVEFGPSRDVENAAPLPTAPMEFIALREPAELKCPKVLSAGRTRTASLDAVQEKFTFLQVAHAQA